MDFLKKIVIYIALIVIFLTSLLISTPYYIYTNINIAIIISAAIIILITILTHKRNQDFKLTKTDYLYLGFIIIGIISTIINADISGTLVVLKLAVFYIVFVFCQRYNPQLLGIKKYISTFMFASFIVIILNVLQNPPLIGAVNYQGIYQNPNNLGPIVATIFIVSFTNIMVNLLDKKKRNLINSIFLSITSFYIVIVTASRTSFFSIIFVLLIINIIFVNNILIKNSSRKNIFKLVIILDVIFICIILFLISPTFNVLYDNIILKNIQQTSNNNIASGRVEIWENILNNSKVWGTETDYMMRTVGNTSHNSFIEHISRYGWIAGFFYVVFWLNSLLLATRYLLKNIKEDPYSILCFSTILLYILMSMFEMLTHSTSMHVALFSLGYLLFKIEKKDDTYKMGVYI